jgi:hypothetical protein
MCGMKNLPGKMASLLVLALVSQEPPRRVARKFVSAGRRGATAGVEKNCGMKPTCAATPGRLIDYRTIDSP